VDRSRLEAFSDGVFAVAITLLAIARSSTGTFFVGTAIAGVGFGGGFQGAIRTVLPLAAPHERAGILSIVYVISYLALGLPAVIAGVLTVHGGGVLTTAREYGAAVMVLSVLALAGQARRSRQAAERQAVPACLTSVPGPPRAARAERRATEHCPS